LRDQSGFYTFQIAHLGDVYHISKGLASVDGSRGGTTGAVGAVGAVGRLGRLSDHRINCGAAGARVGVGDGLIASIEQRIGGAGALPLVRLFLSPVRQSLTSFAPSRTPHA